MDIRINDENYPKLLREIHQPPKLLHVLGELLESDQYAVAMVGSRNATLYGLQVADRIAHDLAAKGITVVSGMARGIDAAAHRGALKAGGRTIAVLGGSLDRCYPKEHKGLMEKIARSGCVISEYAEGTEPRPFNFPMRNRIINGLSLGVIVVEASRRSGSLITAAYAIDEGRQVYAVPGSADSLLSEGTHALIKDGAKLIDSADDVLKDLLPVLKDLGEACVDPDLVTPDENRTESSGPEITLLELIAAKKLTLSEMEQYFDLPPDELRKYVMELELSGRIKRSFDMRYETVDN